VYLDEDMRSRLRELWGNRTLLLKDMSFKQAVAADRRRAPPACPCGPARARWRRDVWRRTGAQHGGGTQGIPPAHAGHARRAAAGRPYPGAGPMLSLIKISRSRDPAPRGGMRKRCWSRLARSAAPLRSARAAAHARGRAAEGRARSLVRGSRARAALEMRRSPRAASTARATRPRRATRCSRCCAGSERRAPPAPRAGRGVRPKRRDAP